ncbi:DUF2087 domain-containing protein [Aneurinibacillus thermoaerophilus]|uniref:DUF2087 domain-containing protein n=1 Tax=Aneurinibacillus thermoaerophilus TaxID=143495 RepID=UPI002E210DD7|nr:DUF2087 domain-containing protein [Aneurinibacillus thermoaerophilus]
MNNSERFWNASLEELKCGYILENEHYICLLCGAKFEKGIIYPDEGTLYEAERYIRLHIEKNHQSVFDYLIQLDKKLTGLTDRQNLLLRLLYQGKSDAEVQKEMNIGSASTIRNYRFVLKEKERQSKVFLAIMELLKEKDKHAPAFMSLHKTFEILDERYNVTEQEREKILKKYFPEGTDGPLDTFPKKEKNKLVVLYEIAKRFDSERTYNEKEINQILKEVYHDYVMVRRYLIDYGFLDRKSDGSQYWLKSDSKRKEEEHMERKKELKRLYKEWKPQAGVYQIKNTKNQKIFIDSTMNLKTINGKKFALNLGGHVNKSLQEDWNRFGEEAFVFEVLETLKVKENGYFNAKDALKKLKQKWLDTLQPYGERGYNQKKS